MTIYYSNQTKFLVAYLIPVVLYYPELVDLMGRLWRCMLFLINYLIRNCRYVLLGAAEKISNSKLYCPH